MNSADAIETQAVGTVRFRRAIVATPDVLGAVTLALTLAVGVTVTFGIFYKWIVLPLAIAAFAGAWILRPRHSDDSRAAVIGSTVAVLGALLWTAVNLNFTGENMVVDRDPAVYALTALWLVNNPSVLIPAGTAGDVAAAVEAASTVALGFGHSPDPLSPEGNHAVSGLAAIAGWLGGTQAVLAANVVVAGLTLAIFYAVARQLVGPMWGLVPPAILALSMPLSSFARSTYSEPLFLALTLGGASVLAQALRPTSTTAAMRQPLVLAGLYFGAVSLTRIDGGLTVAGALIAVTLSVAAYGGHPREVARSMLALLLPALVITYLGIADLWLNSGSYLPRLSAQATAVQAAVVVAAILGLTLAGAAQRVHRVSSTRRGTLALGAVLSAGVFAVLMLSRPIWFTGRFTSGPGYQKVVELLQSAQGIPIDGSRSYDELTLNWIAWYVGWGALLIGLAGLVLTAYVVFAEHRWSWLGALLPLAVPAILYLLRVSILPDQVWAMRRLIIGAVPLIALGTTLALSRLARPETKTRLISFVGLAVVLVWPLTTWSGLFTVRDRVGQLTEAEVACSTIPDGRVVLAGIQPGGMDYTATLRVTCDVEVVRLRAVTPQLLADIRIAWGGTPVALLTFDKASIPWSNEAEPLFSTDIAAWEISLARPDSIGRRDRSLYGGVIQTDGSVTPTLRTLESGSSD